MCPGFDNANPTKAPCVNLLLPEHIEELKRNGFWCAEVVEDFDPWPVVKLFTPDAGCTWLITAIDLFPEDSACYPVRAK